MKSAFQRFIIIGFWVMVGTLALNAQNGPQKPETFIDPDVETYFLKDLDSVVQYAFSTIPDSSRLHKWVYDTNDTGLLTSTMYNWNTLERAYQLNHRYEINYDDGQLTSKAHYAYNWAIKRWRGCDSDGCGKKEWVYDRAGHQTSFTQSYWSKNQKAWVRYDQWVYEFDPYGNQTLYAQFHRDQEYGPWMGNSKYEFSFLPDNKEWASIYYTWDQSSQDWQFFYRYISEYPDEGTTLTTQFRYRDAEGWTESAKYKQEIELNGTIETTVNYTWNEESLEWMANSKEIHHLDSAGRSVLFYRYTWYPNLNDWIPFSKSEKEYDAAGRVSMEAAYAWSRTDNSWEGRIGSMMSIGKRTYEYNRSGQLSRFTQYDWDPDRDIWIGQTDGQVELLYNDQGEVIAEICSDWDTAQEIWVPARRIELNLDEGGQVLKQSQYSWDAGSLDWTLVMRYYFYSSKSTAIHEFTPNEIRVFPNPCDGLLHVEGLSDGALLKVINLQGQLLLSQEIESAQADLSQLPGGLYLLEIEDHGRVSRQKLLLK